MDTVTLLCPISDSVPPETFQTALALVSYAVRNGVNLDYIGYSHRTLIDTARNNLVRQFLQTTSEWAFWMDSDMVFPKETIPSLLRVAKEKKAKIVSGIYYHRGGRNWPVCFIRDPKLENEILVKHLDTEKYDSNKYMGMYALPGPEAKEPFRIYTSGMGCCLIHRSVFETLEDPWFEFIPQKCSEDFYFFVNANEKGFSVWADPSLQIGHIGDPKIVYKEDCYKNLESNDDSMIQPVKESWIHRTEA